MREVAPIRNLAREEVGQAADREVGKAVGDENRDLGSGAATAFGRSAALIPASLPPTIRSRVEMPRFARGSLERWLLFYDRRQAGLLAADELVGERRE